MKFRSNVKMVPIAAMLVAAFGASSQALAISNWVPTQSHATDVSGATAREAVEDGKTLHIAVSLQVRNKAALDKLVAAITSGQSSRVLSSEEVKRQFSPTEGQVAALVNHLRKAGFINIEVMQNNMMVTADGTAATARAAFNVEMRYFEKNGRKSFANVNDPVVPEELRDTVLAVHGLQTMHRAHRTFARMNAGSEATTEATIEATSGSAVSHNPTAWPTIYNATSLPTGANTTVGIITAASLTQTLKDLAIFVKNNKLATPVTSTVNVGGTGTTTSSGPTEWDIDSQDSIGAAGGALKSIIFYNAKALTDADMTTMFARAVSDNKAKVINVSLGGCETDSKNDGSEAASDQAFETGIAQGQTFAVASGDSGSYECSGNKTSIQSYPAVSPYVIAVGGSTVYTTSAGAWSSETVWSCTSYTACTSKNGTGGGGGGVSTTETAPSWQVASGVLGTSTKRGVPDISFSGNPSSGATVIVNGKSASGWGGTSLATPIFVGFWARIQSAHSNTLAFPASSIYKYGVANQSTLFHDITSGSNGGYSAKAGWDYASGFGSINIGNFATFINNNPNDGF
jgi:pseudomonalisin